MPSRPDTLDCLHWNSHVLNPAGNVIGVLDDEVSRDRPTVIVLNEVRRHHDELREWARRRGYRHYQEQPQVDDAAVSEHGNVAILVDERRGDLTVLSHRVVPMRLRWRVFSHNRMHHPRRYERVRLRTAGGRWKVTASHWPTLGFAGGNRLAFAESAARAAVALRLRAPGAVGVDVGDHNEDVPTLQAWGRLVAVTVAGHGVDSCIVAGGSAEVDVLPKHGSDHHLMRYVITRR